MYRNILGQIEKEGKDKDYLSKLQDEFIETVKLFNHLMPDEE